MIATSISFLLLWGKVYVLPKVWRRHDIAWKRIKSNWIFQYNALFYNQPDSAFFTLSIVTVISLLYDSAEYFLLNFFLSFSLERVAHPLRIRWQRKQYHAENSIMYWRGILAYTTYQKQSSGNSVRCSLKFYLSHNTNIYNFQQVLK